MKRPLVGLCIAFCLGILIAAHLKAPFPVFYLLTCLSLISSLIFLKSNLKFTIAIFLVAFFLGATLLKNSQVLPNCHISRITPYKGKAVSIKGIVDSDPLVGSKKTSFTLRAEELWQEGIGQKVCGKVLVSAFGQRGIFYGEELILNGTLYRPFRFSISERLNYRDYLRRQGIYSLLAIKKTGIIRRMEKNRGSPIKRFAFWIKHRIKELFSNNLSPLSASILNAMLLGERKGVPEFVNESLIRSGTIHILAVSGLHVGIVAFILLVLLKAIRIPRKPRCGIIMLLLIVYAILTGARPSIVRATVMALVLLFGYLIERELNIYNSLAFAALIILTINPNQLFNIGFQLSFISVISIVWLSPRIKSLFPSGLLNMTWACFLIGAFSVSSAAWLGTAGIIAYYFKIFSPITVIANMIIVPYMPVIVASGFTLALLGEFLPSLASIFAASCEFFILILLKINSLLVAIPGSYFNLALISVGYCLLYYLLILLIFNFSRVSVIISYLRKA